MNPFMRPSPVIFLSSALACIAAFGLLTISSQAQSQGEFVLKNGRHLAADSVKPTATGFTATYMVGTATQTVNFTAKEVASTDLREPKELFQARTLIASDKAQEAIDLLVKVEVDLRPYQGVPDSWWVRATMLHMDALSTLGRNKEATGIPTSEVLSNLSPDDASLMKDFQEVVAPASKNPLDKVEKLKVLSRRTVDPWLEARIWLEIGNAYSDGGKIEDAVKSWLRVPVFSPAERDLSVRGTILAARGLQQLKRANDGVTLLEDYLHDHLGTPFKEVLLSNIAKIKPKDSKPTPAIDTTPSKPADTTPSEPADTTPSEPVDTTQSEPADTTPSEPADTSK